jgi:hypothetical protein
MSSLRQRVKATKPHDQEDNRNQASAPEANSNQVPSIVRISLLATLIRPTAGPQTLTNGPRTARTGTQKPVTPSGVTGFELRK